MRPAIVARARLISGMVAPESHGPVKRVRSMSPQELAKLAPLHARQMRRLGQDFPLPRRFRGIIQASNGLLCGGPGGFVARGRGKSARLKKFCQTLLRVSY